MTNATKSKQRAGRKSKAERVREQQRRATRQRFVWIAVAVVAVAAVIGALLLSGGNDDGGSVAAPADAVSIDRAPGPQLAIGEPVPAFSAPGLGGGSVAWSDYEGSPTVLVVWASWCPHCQAELPILVPAVQARDGVELVSITTAVGQQPGPTPEGFLADEGLTMTTGVDDEAGTLMQGLGVSGFPTVYYVAADGTVANVSVGESSAEAIESNLDALQAA
jgi:thiol-disulfide isomerase/thioredoxin